jgi:hypothetical protein
VPQPLDHKQQYDQLLKTLVEQKLLSSPQADIAKADSEVTGMAIDEVLIARRWLTEETLHKMAPWLKQLSSPGQQTPSADSSQAEIKPAELKSSDDFDENLQKYRALMDGILGEANK